MRVLRATISVVVAVLLVGQASGLGASAQDKPKIEVVPQIGHSGWISSVAFSPDGRQQLSGSDDKTVKLWDAATGVLVRTFEGHSDRVTSVAFSPNGLQVLSGSWDATLKLWDAATGALVRTFEGHVDGVKSVTFSPDGRQVLSGGDDKKLKLWDAATGILVRTFEGHSDKILSVVFSPDGQQVLSGGGDNTLKLWDAAAGLLLRTFEAHSDDVTSVAFSPDGRQLLSGSWDKTLKLWDAATGTLQRTFEGNADGVLTVAFSPDGQEVLSGNENGTLKLWAATGALRRTFERHSGWAWSVAFSPDGRQVLSGGPDKTLKVWDVASSRLLRTLQGRQYSVSSVALSGDRRVLSGSWDKTLKLWDGATGRLLLTFIGHSERVTSVAFSPNGKQALSGSWDKTLKLWDAATGTLLRTFAGHAASVSSVVFSPDGRQVLSGGDDSSIMLWDAVSGALRLTFKGHAGGVRSVTFSPDGLEVLSGGGDTTLKLWDAVTGTLLRTFEGHSDWITAVTFSSDGRQVLSGSRDKTLKLWDTATGTLLRTFHGHSDYITSVAFAPDGRQALSGSDDATVKLWDLVSGALLRTFVGQSDGVSSASFTPDGRQLLSGSWDGTNRIWDIASGALLTTQMATPSGQWLVITPEGFFASSGKGADQMLSLVRALDVATIDQVHQSLFNPDLVRAALAGDPDGEVADAAKIIDLEKVLDSGPAPIVAITSPVEGSQSKSDVVTVQARITDLGKGIGRIEWRVNGVTAAVAQKPRGTGSVFTLSQHLALDPGDNTIEVVAYNANNLLASLPARTTIRFTGRADQAKPNLYILAIGINAYTDRGWRGHPDSTFAELALAKKDAETFATDMAKAAAGQYGQVKVITALDAQATKDNLGKLIDRIARQIRPRDTFILFAAAHGYSVDGRYYLIPQDYDGGTNPVALAKRAVDQSMLQDWLANRIKAKKAVVFLDTCESGALIAGHVRSRSDTTSEAAIGRLHEATGRPVLTASALGQYAYEDSWNQINVKHGLFTWALLQALRNGDTNGNKLIELSELVAHVQDQVPKLAAKLGGVGTTKSATGGATTTSDVIQQARFGSRGEDFVLVRRLQ